jgi:phosphatidylinositol alpha-1,6-mannosyltransferase
MRTLLLSEYFLPQKGGSVTWLANLYSRFPAGSVVVAAGECDGDDEPVDFSAPIERVSMAMEDRDPTVGSAVGPYFRLIRRLLTLCRREKIRQIHCGKVLPEGWAALCLKLTLRLPYLVFAHGEEITTGFLSRRLRFVLPLVYKQASAVIANSENTKKILLGLGVPEHKVFVLHPSVPVEQFEFACEDGERIRKRHDLGEGPVLLTVGRLQKRKGHDRTIQALPRLVEAFPGLRYVIVGTGEERESLAELAERLGVADNVVFSGLVTDDDLPGYYGACDLFLMPNRNENSDIEGFGIVFLEAAAAGKPAIAGASGGAGEAVVDGVTGLLVDGERSDAVSLAVKRLLHDPAGARRMGAAGYERVTKEFTYDRAARRLGEIAQGCASKPPR